MKKLILGLCLGVMTLVGADYSQMTPEQRAEYSQGKGEATGAKPQDGTGFKKRLNSGNEYQGQSVKKRLRDGLGGGSRGNKRGSHNTP